MYHVVGFEGHPNEETLNHVKEEVKYDPDLGHGDVADSFMVETVEHTFAADFFESTMADDFIAIIKSKLTQRIYN